MKHKLVGKFKKYWIIELMTRENIQNITYRGSHLTHVLHLRVKEKTFKIPISWPTLILQKTLNYLILCVEVRWEFIKVGNHLFTMLDIQRLLHKLYDTIKELHCSFYNLLFWTFTQR